MVPSDCHVSMSPYTLGVLAPGFFSSCDLFLQETSFPWLEIRFLLQGVIFLVLEALSSMQIIFGVFSGRYQMVQYQYPFTS